MQDEVVMLSLYQLFYNPEGSRRRKEIQCSLRAQPRGFAARPWYCPGLARLIPGEGSSVAPVCCRDIPLVPCLCFCCGERAAGILQRAWTHPHCSTGFDPGAVGNIDSSFSRYCLGNAKQYLWYEKLRWAWGGTSVCAGPSFIQSVFW